VRFILIFLSLKTYLNEDDSQAEDRPERDPYLPFLLTVSRGAGAVGLGLGLLTAWMSVREHHGPPMSARETQMVLVTPLIFTIGGIAGGLALALLLAPSEFFDGSAGEKWLKLVGTRNIGTARLVCLLIVLVGFGVLSLVAFAVLHHPEWFK
jgi:hypothetical protein